MKYKLINKNKCFRNGIKKEGESCTFNNNCIHPNCCEVHLCEKVVIDGFDYYVIEEEPIKNNWFLHKTNADCSIHLCIHRDGLHVIGDNNIDYFLRYCKKVIATNNPSIDIPKVVDEVEKLAWNIINNNSSLIEDGEQVVAFTAFYEGYNKAKEIYSNSNEDMIEFYKWVNQPHPEDKRQPTAVYVSHKDFWWYNHNKYTSDELIQIWKDQKPKIIYYA